jgi:stage II sporulation protein AB (anti-sigma F factor)
MIIPSRSQNEAFARSAVSAFAAKLDPTLDELSDIKAAVSEAVTNAIVHAYPNIIGDIEITARVMELDGQYSLYIRVKDKGVGIEDIKQAMQPMFTTDPQGERAGLGFAVMENFMDKLKVTGKKGVGTTVTMIKNLSGKM